MIVLGQVVQRIGVEQLRVGMAMELVLEALHSEEDVERVVWKWQPLQPAKGGRI
jgi:hypothetical protein